MNEQQLQQMVEQVAQALAQGANPNEIMQALVQQGVPEDMAGQIIDAAMQMVEGGQGGQQAQGGQEGGSVLEAVAQEDPELLLAIITEWESLPPEAKQEIVNALQGGGGQQGQGQAQEAQQAPPTSGMFG